MEQVIGNLKLFGSISAELTIKMKCGDNEQCPEFRIQRKIQNIELRLRAIEA